MMPNNQDGTSAERSRFGVHARRSIVPGKKSGLLPVRPGENNNACSKSPLGKTPRKSGMTPIRPDKSPGASLKRKTGLLPVRPEKSPNHGKSPFGQGAKFKSGLLPIKYGDNLDVPSNIQGCMPGKSPHSRHKYKSGLTPIRPNISPGQSKTPYGANGTRPKSGLQPIRPANLLHLNPLETSNASITSRRRSGLMPIRPNLNRDTFDGNGSVLSVSQLRPNLSDTNCNSESASNIRRASGILPTRQSISFARPSINTLKRPNPSIRFTRPSVEPTNLPIQKPQAKKTDPKSLIPISEETESPGNTKMHNLSGIQPLDETADTSFHLKSQSKRKSSIVPRNLRQSNSGRNSQSRIPVSLPAVRALNFSDDEEEEVPPSSVLKDTTSKLNSLQISSQDSKSESTDSSLPEPLKVNGTEDLTGLRRRRAELQAELARVEEAIKRLESHDEISGKDETTTSSLNDLDSPFANIGSPVLVDPVELLAPQDTKRPEDIYKIARKSCSFLKTPKPSAFRKENFPLGGTDDTPNIGSRLAQQLASLYDS